MDILNKEFVMTKIGLFYGSETGNTEEAAKLIKNAFSELVPDLVNIYNIASEPIKNMESFDSLILGTSTWGIGDLPSDWEAVWQDFDAIDLSGKKVAVFGLGDQGGYCDTFINAMATLANKVKELGGTIVGAWPVDGYDFEESTAVVDGKFVGLGLDEDNQSDLTDERVKQWVAELKKEFSI
jgi:flavodoxin I